MAEGKRHNKYKENSIGLFFLGRFGGCGIIGNLLGLCWEIS